MDGIVWDTCLNEADDKPCSGVRFHKEWCIAHTSKESRTSLLPEMSRKLDGCNFLRGVHVTNALLKEVRDAAPKDNEGLVTILNQFDARNTIFVDDVDFSHVRFVGETNFDRAEFRNRSFFMSTHFSDEVSFSAAKFGIGEVSFKSATFSRRTLFNDVTFDPKGQGAISFERASFHEEVNFDKINPSNQLNFNHAYFRRGQSWDRLWVRTVTFDNAVFDERMHAVVLCEMFSAWGTQWHGGVQMEFNGGDIYLEDAVFAQPSLLTSTIEPYKYVSPPRVITFQGANLANLTVSGLTLTHCRFLGAHNIDKLRIDGPGASLTAPSRFLTAPKGWRYARRITLAEEHEYRMARKGNIIHRNSKWGRELDDGLWPLGRPEAFRPNAERLIELYRTLRKGQEEAKNEPVASDFHYGEMEMRRAAVGWRSDGPLLWLHWLTSGYGTRPLRAVVNLLGLVLMSSLVFTSLHVPAGAFVHAGGFIDRWDDGLFLSIESIVSLFRGPPRASVTAQEWLILALRYIGATLLAVTVWSVVNRMKR